MAGVVTLAGVLVPDDDKVGRLDCTVLPVVLDGLFVAVLMVKVVVDMVLSRCRNTVRS